MNPGQRQTVSNSVHRQCTIHIMGAHSRRQAASRHRIKIKLTAACWVSPRVTMGSLKEFLIAWDWLELTLEQRGHVNGSNDV